jgi:hypothetical protein
MVLKMENTIKKGIKLERILGIILLIPPIIGVLLFTINLLVDNAGSIVELRNLSPFWTGNFGYAFDSGGGGFTASTPIYLGLMAIAGAILLKGTDES